MSKVKDVENRWVSASDAIGMSVAELRRIVYQLEHHGLVTPSDMIVSDVGAESNETLITMLCKDELTGLCNRRYFTTKIKRHIEECNETKKSFALFFIDIDGFKAVNDTHGHSVGDGILRAIAANLRGCIRHGDEIARIHGDEFLMMFDDVRTIDSVIALANKVLKAVKKVKLNGSKLNISASVGITMYPHGSSDTLDDLIKSADAAMYQSKHRGKNCFTIFSK